MKTDDYKRQNIEQIPEGKHQTKVGQILVLCSSNGITHQPNIRVLFILNGLGSFALLVAFYVPAFQHYHRLIRWTFIIYTAITILLCFVWAAMSG